ncbi:MAG: PadR family transcriptional regulator [Ekhidna sp.]
MNNESIGVLEEMVLLIVMRENEINGAEVLRQYVDLLNRTISLPAIVSVLKRLEQKGFLTSTLGAATSERGGKRKRLYQATAEGVAIARTIQANRNALWSGI